MSVEFQLGYRNHLKVEDFLARGGQGVGAISLHPKAAQQQKGAAIAAREAGIDVLFDPRTERLTHPGHSHAGLPGYNGEVCDLDRLAVTPGARQRLVDTIVAAHPEEATIITAPYFLNSDERSANLNLDLAEATKLTTSLPVRPVVLLRSRHNLSVADSLVREYASAGFTEVDLRFTPLGSENDSILKIRSAYAIAELFRKAGFRVVLGRSGNIGQAGFALGHLDGYSVGIGEMEHVDHAADLSRQKRPIPRDENGKKKGGRWDGVYLPGLAATVAKKRAVSLLGNSDIRTRLGCRIGSCAHSLTGPLTDPQGHYLHAKAAEMSTLIGTPAAWRPKLETDRLTRAIELRELINDSYRADGETAMKTRTLHSLIDGIEEKQTARVA